MAFSGSAAAPKAPRRAGHCILNQGAVCPGERFQAARDLVVNGVCIRMQLKKVKNRQVVLDSLYQ